MKQTKEAQYQECIAQESETGFQRFVLMSNHTWLNDPKRVVFLLSRYKFVAKNFAGLDSVLEIGCADAFGTDIVAQEVNTILASDFDPVLIEDAKSRSQKKNMRFALNNFVESALDEKFDGIYALDVLEHIMSGDEEAFLSNAVSSLKKNGVMIMGMPSLESQAYASEASKEGHVNCQSGNQLKETMSKYFHNVFIFSMNDEVVHTGFFPMAHYLLALCCNPKKK